MNYYILQRILSLIMLICPQIVMAANLLESYQHALRYDPVFQQARLTHLSQAEAVPQARAALLPSLITSANATHKQEDTKPNNAAIVAGKEVYDTQLYTINVTQPLFNLANWQNLRVAKASTKKAEATYQAAQQTLMMRVVTAYFAVLESKEALRFTQSWKKASKRQLDQVKQRYDVGLDPITVVYEVQATYDSVLAQEIAARNDLENKKEALRQITGHFYSRLAELKRHVPLQRPEPVNAETWVTTALRQNYDLMATHYLAEQTANNIKLQNAGHYPTVDAVGQYQHSRNESTGLAGGTIKTGTVSVQVAFPIFQGGLVVSKTQQARYDHQVALAKLDAIRQETAVMVRQTFNDILAGIQKVKADKQAVKSAEQSLASTTAQFEVGTRTILDVLQVQKNLYEQQKSFATDQYSYIKNTLKLKQLAGSLSENDLRQVNVWLATKVKKS